MCGFSLEPTFMNKGMYSKQTFSINAFLCNNCQVIFYLSYIDLTSVGHISVKEMYQNRMKLLNVLDLSFRRKSIKTNKATFLASLRGKPKDYFIKMIAILRSGPTATATK